jgi:hypothetical protein
MARPQSSQLPQRFDEPDHQQVTEKAAIEL